MIPLRKRKILEEFNRTVKKYKMPENIFITNSKELIIPSGNFKYSEYFHPSTGGHGEFHMPLCLAKANQFIRDYYSAKYNYPIPWTITSTYRPNSWGDHKTGNAVDSVPSKLSLRTEIFNDITNEFKNWLNSELVKGILSTGVTVGIIENVCLHLAYRTHKLNNHPMYDPPMFYLGRWKPTPKGQEAEYPYGVNTCYA